MYMIFDDSVPALLSTVQAAHLLGIQPNTLAAGRCDGTSNIPFIRVGGRSIRYSKKEIEAYLKANQHGESLCED
jgi:hypothetical protein